MRDPSRIGTVLGTMAAGWGVENPLESARIVSSWTQVVGPEVAAKCRPTSLKGGVLRVHTDSAAWASEFRFLAAEVRSRINAELGREVVREVKPWVGPHVKDNRGRREIEAVRQRIGVPSVDPAVLSEADDLARRIGDERVADALRKAVVAARIRQGKEAGVVQLEDIHCPPQALSRTRSGSRGKSNEQARFSARGPKAPRRELKPRKH